MYRRKELIFIFLVQAAVTFVLSYAKPISGEAITQPIHMYHYMTAPTVPTSNLPYRR